MRTGPKERIRAVELTIKKEWPLIPGHVFNLPELAHEMARFATFLQIGKGKTMKAIMLAAGAAFLMTQAASAQTSGNPAPGNTAPGGVQEFMNVPAQAELSSNVVGLDVYNASNQDIGTIKDIAVINGDVKAYIVGVGGFLGVGDHYVAVRPSAVAISYDSSQKKWHAQMDTTASQLKAAPEFKYTGPWSAGKI